METRPIRGMSLYYQPEELAAADLVADACARSTDLIRVLWELPLPQDCHVYVMTSWQQFLLHSAPWPWRIYLLATWPLRQARMQQIWELAGGWTQQYGKRWVIGVKPPRLLEDVDLGLRQRIFVQREVREWVQHNTCHELVHAASGELGLPSWLHEGLAMVTVDRLSGRPTVRARTLGTLVTEPPDGGAPGLRRGTPTNPESLIRMAVRGYWITRYLDETQPYFMPSLLKSRQSHEALESRLAAELGLSREQFWSTIDRVVISHFGDGSQGRPA